MSEITVRDTGMVGVTQKVAVYHNGEPVDKLSNNETKTLAFGETVLSYRLDKVL